MTARDYFNAYGGDTFEKLFNAVEQITKKLDAQIYFAGYVDYLREKRPDWSTEQCETTARHNIGWMFGEGLPQTQKDMWHEAVGATHPVFGMATPTAQEAFEAGFRMGEKLRGQ